MKKRILSILLSVFMIMSLAPLTAFAGAEVTYPLWVGGIGFNIYKKKRG